jgi:hypothetical protein
MPANMPVITPSSGEVPFGVDFDLRGHLLVVEAGANAASSYRVTLDGSLQTISGSVPNGQAATCWIVVNPHGDVILLLDNLIHKEKRVSGTHDVTPS